MITMMPASAEEISGFFKERFPVGTLTCSNLLSLHRYLLKITAQDNPQSAQVFKILQDLHQSGFFKSHMANLTQAQMQKFYDRSA